MIECRNPESVSRPFGYSHVAISPAGQLAHISGQVAIDDQGAVVGEGDITAQAEQVFANLAACLSSVGADFSTVVKLVTYVVDLNAERAAAIRAVRMRWLAAGPYPASTMVGISALVDARLLLEVEAIAALHHQPTDSDAV